jgi:3-dehydroquinate dehydratase/shikimate dehydrogenase
MTRLCVPIFVNSLEQAKRDVSRAIEAGADIVELRTDTVEGIEIPHQLLQAFPQTRFIVTRRAERQGGHATDHDVTRLFCLADDTNFLPAGGLIDVEFDSAQEAIDLAVGQYVKDGEVIFSQHDFKGRPADLTKTFFSMQDSPAAVAKLAWQARSIRDNLEAFELMQAGPKPTIAICMGEAGAISRILAKKFGAFLTFASLDDTSATAPGQLTIAELKNTYRWDAMGPKTKVYGVVGAPVGHSMSPAIHNAGFDAIGFDGVYVPLLVQPGYESFKAFMETFRAFKPLDLAGLSITIPHKENALRYAREHGDFQIDALAERIGAVNTYAFDVAGKDVALSTDYDAIVDTITTTLGIHRDGLKGLRVAIVGAGGTGRTAVAALRHFGANVSLFNRTPDRAIELALELGAIAKSIESIAKTEADVWINTTSLGMSPNVDASIFDAGVPTLGANTLVFDTVYNPIETKLLKLAREHGAKTASGVEMFVRQAAGQFELWTGRQPPMSVMRDVVRARLGDTKH